MVSSRGFIAIGLCISLFICFLLALIIFTPSHPHSPKLSPKLSPEEFRVDSDTTTVSLNFTGRNLTIEGDITIYFSNPSNSVNIFYNPISVYVYYNVSDNPKKSEFLASTYFPSIYVGANAGGHCTNPIYINSSTVNNTLDIGSAAGSGLVNFFIWLSASVKFNGTLFNSEGYLLNVFCYPLHSHVSSNVTNNATTVLLDGLSC